MHTTIYVSIYALIIIWLSMKVIKSRWKHKVSTGDGSVEELQIAIGTQSNAIEYLPITLLLLFALEFNGGAVWLVHLFAVVVLVGRISHINGMYLKRLKYRVFGMQLTFFSILSLALVNAGYFFHSIVF